MCQYRTAARAECTTVSERTEDGIAWPVEPEHTRRTHAQVVNAVRRIKKAGSKLTPSTHYDGVRCVRCFGIYRMPCLSHCVDAVTTRRRSCCRVCVLDELSYFKRPDALLIDGMHTLGGVVKQLCLGFVGDKPEHRTAHTLTGACELLLPCWWRRRRLHRPLASHSLTLPLQPVSEGSFNAGSAAWRLACPLPFVACPIPQ